MSLFPVFRQIVVLFLLMGVGYASNRLHIMTKESERLFSRVLVNLTCPALILSSVTTSGRLDSGWALLHILGVAVSYFVILPVVARLLACLLRVPAVYRAEYESMLIYSNLGFMGIPVISAVLGTDAILYITIFMAVFNVSVFSYGTILLQPAEQKAGNLPLRKMINPGTVSAALALVLYALDIQLPDLIYQPVSLLGNVTTPLAMLVVGSSLAGQPLRVVLREMSMLPFTACRLILLPLLTLAVCRPFVADPFLVGTLTLVSAMPVASNVVMISSELGRDTDYISKGVFFSTLFSIVSIPLVSAVLNI
ncbi:AEC family transporter [Agathobaculum sp. Marseille-P7918]|uniref:AEC family transporter n=1 Tax=Agathobaculum sp. Marseille-P7918 TaxID=2479843 RepID=UPI003569520F